MFPSPSNLRWAVITAGYICKRDRDRPICVCAYSCIGMQICLQMFTPLGKLLARVGLLKVRCEMHFVHRLLLPTQIAAANLVDYILSGA